MILLACHGNNVISGICLADSVRCERVCRFVVCDGSSDLIRVGTDDEIAVDMDLRLVYCLTGSRFLLPETGIMVYDYDFVISEIKRRIP